MNCTPSLQTSNRFAPLSIDEIADNESACLPDRENEIPVVPQTPIPPRSSSKRIPRWERRLPSHYTLAATPDANSFNIDTQIQTTDTGEVHSQPSLLDSGATDLFIDSSYLQEKRITPKTLSNPIPVYNVDGSPTTWGLFGKSPMSFYDIAITLNAPSSP